MPFFKLYSIRYKSPCLYNCNILGVSRVNVIEIIQTDIRSINDECEPILNVQLPMEKG